MMDPRRGKKSKGKASPLTKSSFRPNIHSNILMYYWQHFEFEYCHSGCLFFWLNCLLLVIRWVIKGPWASSFLDQLENTDGYPSLWLAETCSTFLPQSLNRIRWNLNWSHLLSYTKFVLLCAWAKGIVRRLSVCVNFSHFQLLLWNHWTVFYNTWHEARSQHPLPSLFFPAWSVKQRWLPWPLIGWDIFKFSAKVEWNSRKLDRKQDLEALYHICAFWADRKTKMAALTSDYQKLWRNFDFFSATAE